MSDPDILVRLRESDGGYFMRKMFTDAADEIERLRKECDRLAMRNTIVVLDVERLKAENVQLRTRVETAIHKALYLGEG